MVDGWKGDLNESTVGQATSWYKGDSRYGDIGHRKFLVSKNLRFVNYTSKNTNMELKKQDDFRYSFLFFPNFIGAIFEFPGVT